MSNNKLPDRMKDVDILAKHLAESIDVQIEFQDGVCPQTDGKRILLPTELNKQVLIELLATLIHETFHIRLTDLQAFTRYDLNHIERDMLNVLEDIRIDDKAIEKYPQAKELYECMYKYSLIKVGDKLKAEPLPQKVLKHLLLLAAGQDNLIYDNTAMEVIKELNLTRYITRAKDAMTTQHLVADAKRLAVELLGKMQDMKQKALQALPTQVNTDGTISKPSRTPEHQQTIDKQKDILKNTASKQQAESKKSYEHRDKSQASEMIRRSEQRKSRLNDTKAKKYEYDMEVETDDEKLNKLSAKASQAHARADEANSKAQVAEIERIKERDLDITHRDTATKLARECNTLSDALDNMEKNELCSDSLYETNENIQINGFSALDIKDVIEQYEHIELPRTLDDILREFFVAKQEQKQNVDEGNKLNCRELSHLFTDGSNLFNEIKEQEHKTRVSFLVDCSGSMHGLRASLTTQALGTLTDSLNRVIDENALPVEVAVFAFDDEVYILKDFDEHITGEQLAKKYHVRGGTELLKSVNFVSEHIEALGDDSDNVMIIMTDAGVYGDQLTALRNQVKQNTKRLYIGIEANMENENVKTLFRHNITSKTDIVNLLSQAIMTELDA